MAATAFPNYSWGTRGKAGDGQIAAALKAANNAEELAGMIVKFGRVSTKLAGGSNLVDGSFTKLFKRMAEEGIIPKGANSLGNAFNTVKQLADDFDTLVAHVSDLKGVKTLLHMLPNSGAYGFLTGRLYHLTTAVHLVRKAVAEGVTGAMKLEVGKERLDLLIVNLAYETKLGFGGGFDAAIKQIATYKKAYPLVQKMHFAVPDAATYAQLTTEIARRNNGTVSKLFKRFVGVPEFIPQFYGKRTGS